MSDDMLSRRRLQVRFPVIVEAVGAEPVGALIRLTPRPGSVDRDFKPNVAEFVFILPSVAVHALNVLALESRYPSLKSDVFFAEGREFIMEFRLALGDSTDINSALDNLPRSSEEPQVSLLTRSAVPASGADPRWNLDW